MIRLSQFISISHRFARSINLDRDRDLVEPLEDYIVTGRALNVVEQIATVAAESVSGSAWSVTGPYGSGKSSLALLIDAAFGPDSRIRDISWNLIEDASPETAALIRQSHSRAGTTKKGFHRGVITASREPVGYTILRALHTAVIRSFGKIPPTRHFKAAKELTEAYKIICSDIPKQNLSPTAVLEVARCLAQDAPLFLIIDEFGKNLEAVRDDSIADPYLLQQLAESGQGLGLPVFILTFQHQSVDDYLVESNDSQRLEWSKVQGRFENIPYIESNEQSRQLISSVFRVSSKRFIEKVNIWAISHFSKISKLGITDFESPNEIASCYPLHPLTTMVVPELCNKYGQHERTMFSFLTGSDPASVNEFVTKKGLEDETDLPSVGLDSVFDYFVGRGTLVNVVSSQQNRWIELATRIRDVNGLSNRELRLAKAISILNMMSTAGNLRASRQIIEYTGLNVFNDLEKLESMGLVIYREHSDEYRLWQGSSVKVSELIEDAIQRVEKEPINELLNEIDSPLPIVAARHSTETETLRIFHSRYSDGDEEIEPIQADSPYDGELILVVGSKIPTLKYYEKTQKPTVCAIPESSSALMRSIRQVASLKMVLKKSSVQNDHVAFSELRERMAIATSGLEESIRRAFYAGNSRWIQLNDECGISLERGKGSAPLSEVADRVYKFPPDIRSEMINRVELSTQGSKARRLVIEAMIRNGHHKNLQQQGFGPEVAISKAVLEYSGIHGFDARNRIMVFRKPTNVSFRPMWNAIEDEFNRAKNGRVNVLEIYRKLTSPPYGVKAGVIPITFTAALLAYRDEIAIYEHGTFQLALSPALAERMVKNPQHFDIKHFANATGARRQVVEALAKCFKLSPKFRKHRVANVLTVVEYLVSKYVEFNDFTLYTEQNLSSKSIQVRDALMNAVEPDDLLFSALPKAVGFSLVRADQSTYEEADKFAVELKTAVDNLDACYGIMLDNLMQYLLECCSEDSRHAVSGQATSLKNKVLNPSVKSFITTLANRTRSDKSWIESIATVVSHKAPENWTDVNCVHFRHELKRNLSAFRRLLALHIDSRASEKDKFNAYRVTFTKPNGSEFIDLVCIDESLKEDSDAVLENALNELIGITGSKNQAHRTLLALISERLFEKNEELEDTKNTPIDSRKAQNG